MPSASGLATRANVSIASAGKLARFEAIVHYLTGASHTAPLVVVLDHLHRADAGSLRLLAHLAESVPASRLLVAVSYRSGEAATLPETSAALARAGAMRIELTGLNIQDTQILASAMLHRDISKPTAERLSARTEGNPFFLRELTKLLTSEQHLDQPHMAPVPVPVREVELGRIARLPPNAAEVLSVAAIAGRNFDIDVVAEAASVEIEAVLEILDTAVAAGLIVEDQRLGWFRFTHALTAQAIYETTGRLRRAPAASTDLCGRGPGVDGEHRECRRGRPALAASVLRLTLSGNASPALSPITPLPLRAGPLGEGGLRWARSEREASAGPARRGRPPRGPLGRVTPVPARMTRTCRSGALRGGRRCLLQHKTCTIQFLG